MSSLGVHLQWVATAQTVTRVGFYSSFVGLVVLCLNYAGVQKMIGRYKYLTMGFTVFGIIAATLGIITCPYSHNFNAGALFFSLEQPLGAHLDGFLPATYPFSNSGLLALLSTQFIYRYWAVFDAHKLRFFNKSYLLIWPTLCFSFGLVQVLTDSYFFATDNISTEYFREEMRHGYNWTISEYPLVSILPYNPLDGSIRWRIIMGLLNLYIGFSFHYAFMMYCGWSMLSGMNEKIKNFSEILRKLEKQLFRVLMLQMIAFTFLNLIPTVFITLLPMFNLKISLPTGSLLSCSLLYPATTSMITMILVSEYKNSAKQVWVRIWYFGGTPVGDAPGVPTTTPDEARSEVYCAPMMNFRNFPTAHI